MYSWLVLIASRNYGTHTVIIGEKYAAHLLKTRKKSVFIITFFSHPPPLFMSFFYLQELLFNNKSLPHRAALKKTRKYATLVPFLKPQSKNADKTAWPLYSPIRTKSLSIEAASLGRDNLYTVNVYAFIAAMP